MAFDVITPVKLGQAAITATVATLYTTPTSTRTLVKDMHICNTTAGSVNVTLYLVPTGGTAGTSNALLIDKAVASKDTYRWEGVQVMNAGDTIQVIASATGCTITASGAEAV